MFRSTKNRRGSQCAEPFEGMEGLEQRLSLSTINWTGAGDGVTLNNRCNWQCNQLPGIYDTAVINVSGTPHIKLTTGSFKVKKFIQAEDLTVTGGTLEVGSGGMTLSGSMTMAGGQFGGTGVVNVGGTLNWTAGKIVGTGKIDVGAAGRFDIDGTGSLELRRDVTNHGKINWHGGDIEGLDTNGNTVVNEAGAVFRAMGSTRFRSITAPGLFDNRGTFVRDEAGHSRFLVRFNNSGTLNVAEGTLELWGGGDNTGARNVAEAGTLHYFGDFTHGAGSTLIGGGNTYWQGGMHTITGAWSMQSYLWLVGATVGGDADFTIDGVLGWSHGRMEGTGNTIIGTGGKLEIRTEGQHEIARDIDNHGVLIWNKGELKFDGATVTNPVGQTFYICANATAVNGSGINRIVNQGEMRKQLPTDLGFGDVTLDNTGLLNVRNGSLTLNQGAVAQLSGGTLSAGEWIAFGSANLSFSGAMIETIGAAASVTRFGRHAGFAALGSLSRNEGAVHIYGGDSLEVTPAGGTFTNAGMFFLNNSTALRIQGNFVQTAAGTLNIGIGGQHLLSTGRAIAANSVTLDGNVVVTHELGYVPQVGDRFLILEGATSGGGTALLLPELTATAQLVYLPNGVMLIYV